MRDTEAVLKLLFKNKISEKEAAVCIANIARSNKKKESVKKCGN